MILRVVGEKEFGRKVHFAAAPVDSAPAAESLLSRSELKKYKSFPVEKRRKDWLAGRWVAKSLVLEALGRKDAFSMMEIMSDDDGQPFILYPALKPGAYSISLTHSGGMAAAAVDPSGRPIGVDLEKIEERHPSWSPVAFHKDELKGEADASTMTRLWTVKEAVLKLLGLGLSADLHEVRMRPGLTLYGKAQERHARLGSPPIKLSTWEDSGYWYTIAACGEGGNK